MFDELPVSHDRGVRSERESLAQVMGHEHERSPTALSDSSAALKAAAPVSSSPVYGSSRVRLAVRARLHARWTPAAACLAQRSHGRVRAVLEAHPLERTKRRVTRRLDTVQAAVNSMFSRAVSANRACSDADETDDSSRQHRREA